MDKDGAADDEEDEAGDDEDMEDMDDESDGDEIAELTQKINSALADNSTLELEDDKGRKYLVRTDRVVYVEVGIAKKHAVGFAGA